MNSSPPPSGWAALCAVNWELWGVHYSQTKAALALHRERWPTLLYDKKWLKSHCNISPILFLPHVFQSSAVAFFCVWTAIDPPDPLHLVCNTDIALTTVFYHFPSISLPCSSAHRRQTTLTNFCLLSVSLPLLYMLVGTCTTLRLRLTDRLLKWSLGSRMNSPPSSTRLPSSSTSLISTALKYSYYRKCEHGLC